MARKRKKHSTKEVRLDSGYSVFVGGTKVSADRPVTLVLTGPKKTAIRETRPKKGSSL